jgi:RimJ/RimL family protein N-acetyltransferase
MLPHFATERLLLRERSLDDLDALCAMDAEPEVMRFIGAGAVPDPAAHRGELVARIGHDFGPGLGYWSVFPKDDPATFLGWIALHPLPGWEPDVEIGWRFRTAAWGRGYATEAARAVLAHAFETVGLDPVVSVIAPANDRSRRVLEKLGFEGRGRRRAWNNDCLLYVRAPL